MHKKETSLHVKSYESEAEQLSTYSSGYVTMNCSPRSYSQDSYSVTSYIPGGSYDTENLDDLYEIISKVLCASIV